MLDNIMLGVPLNQVFNRIDIEGNEHLFIENKSGSVCHICVEKGINRTVLNSPQSNDYFYTGYSSLSNCYYLSNQDGIELLEYNPITGENRVFNMIPVGGWPYNSPSQFTTKNTAIPYIPQMSTDGHIYIGLYLYRGLYGYQRFNVLTKEFDLSSCIPDDEFSHIQMRRFNSAFYIDTGAFAGVYSTYIWSDSADGYVDLRDTILAEIVTSGLTFTNNNYILLHQDDRDLASTTRRVFTAIGSGNTWKIVDLKSPSTYINTDKAGNDGIFSPIINTCTTELGVPVSKTNWTSYVPLYDLAVQAGLTVPTLDSSIAYGVPQKVGRFVYVGKNYLGNASHFYNFLIHPDTGKAVYTYSFDKYTTYCQSQWADYVCNFGGDHGFSSDVEIVRFLSDISGNWYFFSPATKLFVMYNITTDPDDYIIRTINLDDFTDPLGFGVYHNPRFSPSVTTLLNEEEYYVDPNSFCNVALASIYGQEVLNGFTTVTYRVLADKSKPDEYFDFTFRNLYANAAELTTAVILRDAKAIAVGEVYSGVSAIDIADEDNFTLKKYIGNIISPNGAIKINGNLLFVYGYSGRSHIIDATDWENVTKIDIPSGESNEVIYATVRSEGVLALGQKSRSVGYHEGCVWNLVDIVNNTTTGISSRFPNEFNFRSAIDIRTTTGLTAASPSDGTVAAAVLAYMSSSGQTRAQVIAEFLDTCRWKISDAHTYGTKTVVGLGYQGVLGLDGMRIEETTGSGIWIDQSYYSTQGGKALLIDTTDILNVAPSEIKPVQFNLTPNVQSMGRVAGSTNYLAFIVNDPTNEQGFIRVVSKTDFETAANGSGIVTIIPTVVTIDFGGGSSYGFGDTVYFDNFNTHCSNAYFCEGDNLYITCRSNINEGGGLYACVIKVDLATGSSETFVKSATRATRAISYDGTRMLITNGTSLVINDNFTSQVGSITI